MLFRINCFSYGQFSGSSHIALHDLKERMNYSHVPPSFFSSSSAAASFSFFLSSSCSSSPFSSSSSFFLSSSCSSSSFSSSSSLHTASVFVIHKVTVPCGIAREVVCPPPQCCIYNLEEKIRQISILHQSTSTILFLLLQS